MAIKGETPFHPHLSTLAAIRWYANTIENFAIQKYFARTSNWDRVEEILKKALTEMNSIDFGAPDCPWPLCSNRECAPECPYDGKTA